MDYMILFYMYIKSQIKSNSVYRFNFIASSFGALFLYCSQYLPLWTILHFFGTINGWNIYEVSLLYGFWLFTYGFQLIFCAGIRDFRRLVHTGDLDIYLLRPNNVLFQVICGKSDLTAWVHTLIGATTIFLSSKEVVTWSLIKFIQLSEFLLAGAIIQAGLLILWATMVFWMINNNSLTFMGWTLSVNYMTFPLSAYDFSLHVFFTIVPMAFITYYPVGVLIEKFPQESLSYILGNCSLIVSIIFFVVVYRFWKFGLKNYQGTGN
ncbi:ABC transporter permease [Paenibacillus sp. YYML68]|uniref:ABC transporter permease n=1 Tax=Paenibacillus sp. YYML68 TaxID=2909250 RepID=UPI002491FFCB|nr:ABC-2 family transporter protein [Paenibacillus sp. YYML68]